MNSMRLGVRSWNIFGVNVMVCDQRQAIATLDGNAAAGVPTRVAFANTNLLNLAASDTSLRARLAGFMVLNDGIGADIAARILYGRPFPSNMNGTDFVPAYLQDTALNHRIFIVGSRPDVVPRAAGAFQARFAPRHQVVGCVDGFQGLADTAQLVRRIAATRATLLLVGLGNPRQERWIADHMAATGCNLAFGIGALLDFAAGEVRRAPPALQRMRLEWAYRLAQEPRRLFRRYVLETPVFLCRTLAQRLNQSAQQVAVNGSEPTR